MSQLDCTMLAVALIAWGYNMFWSESWTHTISRYQYARWRAILNSWIALPGWLWMPFIAMMVGFASSGAFLYMRNSFPHDDHRIRIAIYALFFPNVFCFQFWTPLMLWGPYYWWAAAVCSFWIFITGLAITILMGIEHAFLPMGLWIAFTVFAGFVMLATAFFWWYGNEVARAMSNWAASLPKSVTQLGAGLTPFGMGVVPPGFLFPPPSKNAGYPMQPASSSMHARNGGAHHSPSPLTHAYRH